MFHSGTQRLIETWAALPDAQRIPRRDSIDPAAFGGLLPQVFMAERRDDGVAFRLAGGWIERLHGRSLKGVRWLDLWDRGSRLLVHSGVTRTFREARPLVLLAAMDDSPERLEICLCPLRGTGGTPDRLIGLYQPQSAQGMATRDIAVLTARASVPAEVGFGRPALSLAAQDGRRLA